MIRGLLEKSLRESWVAILLGWVALGLVAGLLTLILPQFQEGLNELILEMPFFRMMITGLMGIDASEGVTSAMLLSIVWSHPIVLAITWGFAIVLCSRVPAGEIERGTIDVLLGWPVSRGAVYLSETIVWVAAGAVLLLSGFLGSQIAALTLPIEQRPEGTLVLLALANFFAVYVVVGSVTQLVAAAGNRRGATMGVALAFVLASFLFNFLAQFWAPAERVVFASFVHYYQPAAVMLQGAVPIRNIAILLAWGGVAWALGYVVWRRRSVLTI